MRAGSISEVVDQVLTLFHSHFAALSLKDKVSQMMASILRWPGHLRKDSIFGGSSEPRTPHLSLFLSERPSGLTFPSCRTWIVQN